MWKILFLLLIAALLCSASGFYKYVYFISIGYGFAITGQGIAMLLLFSKSLGMGVILVSSVFIIYGLRLGLFLLFREIKSSSYQKHMVTEIKDGSSMNFFLKILLWIFCALLYVCMVSPAVFRFYNGHTTVTPSLVIGLAFMIFGIGLESYSDYTKNRLKKRNPKRFCSEGVFRIVRCPNYLGELLLWTGVFLLGVTSMKEIAQWIIAILGYIGIVFVMFSGARRLEVRQNRNYGTDPEYREYVKTVPILLPFIPLYSVEKYKFLVL